MAKHKIFTLSEIWNTKVRNSERSRVKKRDYIGSSDIGRTYIDRYYKMKGVAPSNPFEERVLRIFDSGKWFEQLVTMVYSLSGLIQQRQPYFEIPGTKDRLKVIGYGDAIIGGTINWDDRRARVAEAVKTMGLMVSTNEGNPDVVESIQEQVMIFEQYAYKVIDELEKIWGTVAIPPTAIEFKTINSLAFWRHKNRTPDKIFLGYDHHKLQQLASLHGLNLDFGRVTYISKDDLMLEEVGVKRGMELEKAMWEDIDKMSYYYMANEEPPKEPEIVYNERKKVFEGNWEVKRSPYLTLIYGYKSQDDFDSKHHQELLDINRALRHVRKGKIKEEDHPVIKAWELEKYA